MQLKKYHFKREIFLAVISFCLSVTKEISNLSWTSNPNQTIQTAVEQKENMLKVYQEYFHSATKLKRCGEAPSVPVKPQVLMGKKSSR